MLYSSNKLINYNYSEHGPREHEANAVNGASILGKKGDPKNNERLLRFKYN